MSGERHDIVRPRARPGVIAAAVACAAVLLTAPTASADTSVGAVGTIATAWGCAPGLDLIQASPAATYTVTRAGSITAWSTVSGPHIGRLALTVWRPTPTPDTYTLVGVTADQAPAPNALNTFTLGANSIDVLPHDVIGVRTTAGIPDCLTVTGVATDLFVYSTTQVTTTGAAETFPPAQNNVTFALNISAELTPRGQDGCGDGQSSQDVQFSGDHPGTC